MKIIEQDKFSENIISFRYPFKLNEKTVTAANVLCYLLKDKTELYPDKQAISMNFNRNYGFKMYVGLTCYGKNLVLQTRFQYIRPDLIEEKDYEDNVIEMIDQFINHPILDEGKLEEAKYLLKNRLSTQKDDPASLSMLSAFSLLKEDSSISVPVGGIYDKVDTVTFDEVLSVYNECRQQKPYVYACGQFDEKTIAYCKEQANEGVILADYELIDPSLPYREKTIKRDIEQTNITKVYATDIDTRSKDYYSLLLMNSVLGQSQINLLFQEIREKNSFCYYISSNIVRFDGALYILVGCQKENVDSILKLIDVQINRLITMDYSDDYLECAKKDWLDGLVAQKDSEFAYVEKEFIRDMLQKKTPLAKSIELVNNVTKQDIANCAKKLKAVSCAVVMESEE